MYSKQERGEWAVFDTAARQEDPTKPGEIMPRVHESRPGRAWPLRNNVPCYMPEPDARVFLKDPAFVVHDEVGNLVPGLAREALLRTVPTELAPHLVIADLNELTTDSLLTRAMQRPGGQKLTRETPRHQLVQFLLDGLEQVGGLDDEDPILPGRARVNERDMMDPDMAAKLLEGV